ncbi:hypothetical protein [Leclercia sp.]|uniref:hypothetical protein n=1 Tax=Leclercia sp. TaxID=1898428 RepID=UPI002FDE907C
MIKMIGLTLLMVSVTAFAADDKGLKEEEEKAQREITLSGYQCDQVDSIKIETSWFSSGTTSNVTCDKAYHFKIRYKGDTRVSVEVVTM